MTMSSSVRAAVTRPSTLIHCSTMFCWYLCLIEVSLLPIQGSAFDSFAGSSGWIRGTPLNRLDHARIHIAPVFMTDDSFVDVEFERIDSNQDSQTDEAAATTQEQQDVKSSPKSLLDLSLDLDPDWKDARIPFVDPSGRKYIDCKLAFTVDLDGVSYGIGVPFEAAAAMTLEQPDGKVAYLSPDDPENDELMEIMANQLQELIGDDVFLKKTPKILTIAGDLDKYTKNWKDELFGETIDKETLLDNSDENLNFFYDFMKSELGEDEFEKAMKEASEESVDEELLKLFDVPGLDGQDNEDMKEMLKSVLDVDQLSEFEKIGEDLEHEGVALKLVGFNFSDGKAYTLVKLLKPFTIVGKYNVEDKEDLRFDLLTPGEEKLVIPRLEKLCEQDLERAGLSLSEFD